MHLVDAQERKPGRCLELFRRLLVLAVIQFGLFSAPHGLAQTPKDPNGASSAQKISELATKLNDDQSAALVRMLEVLAEENQVMAVTPSEMPGFSERLQTMLMTFSNEFQANILEFPSMIAGTIGAIADVFSSRGPAGSLSLISLLAIVLGVGIAANYVVARIAAPLRASIRNEQKETFADQLWTLTLRLGLEISGLLAFIVAAIVATNLIVSEPADHAIIMSLLVTLVLVPRLASAFARFVLAPARPDIRMVAANDGTARLLFLNLIGLAAFIGGALFVLGLIEQSVPAIAETYLFWIGVSVLAWIIILTWRARSGLTTILKGDDEKLTPGLEFMAQWWPIASIVVIALAWLFMQFAVSAGGATISAGQGATALALIVAAPFLDTMLRGIVRHMLPPMEGDGPIAEDAYDQTRFSYIRIGRVFLFAVLIFVIGGLTGISFQNLAEAGLGAQIAANGVQFLLVLAAGYIAWEVTNLWVNRQLARESAQDATHSELESDGEVQHSKSRLASILPLVHMTLQVAIITITTLLALSNLGFNITPLLAGAGVIGLAIGFGAQALVKDVVSGVFFLLDDAFRVGEFIDVGGTMGAVEKISIRSMQLRGAKGPIHIVPYGEISKLTNHSRDWVIVKLRFTVPFDTDVEKVRKLFKKIGQDIMQDPELAEDLLSPFKSQGVAEFGENGIVVRGKFTTKPGRQFAIRKEVFSRIQQAFDENGIQFARKEVKVQIPGLKENESLNAAQKEAVAAAAAEAAETETVPR